MALDNVQCGQDLTVHHHHDTPATGICRRTHLHRMKKIGRSIRAQRCCGAHAAGQHDWFIGAERKMQKQRCFLKCIGTMSNHHTGHVFSAGLLADRPGEQLPLGRAHILGIQRKQVLPTDLCDVRQIGNDLQQISDRQLTGSVSKVRSRIGAASDGSAGTDDDDLRF